MMDKPIIFSPSMIRAILEGRKGQTRRVVNVKKYAEWLEGYSATGRLVNYYGDHRLGLEFTSDEHGLWNAETNPNGRSSWCVPVPYHPGMRLWVRENWTSWRWNNKVKPRDFVRLWGDNPARDYVGYPADNDTTRDCPGQEPISMDGRERPSIHMPRWASRLTLEVTAVKVERLQEISHDDAVAEGIREFPCHGPHRGADATFWTHGDGKTDQGARTTPVDAFHELWSLINGEDSWFANPWVVAVTFKTHRMNIDHMPKAEPTP